MESEVVRDFLEIPPAVGWGVCGLLRDPRQHHVEAHAGRLIRQRHLVLHGLDDRQAVCVRHLARLHTSALIAGMENRDAVDHAGDFGVGEGVEEIETRFWFWWSWVRARGCVCLHTTNTNTFSNTNTTHVFGKKFAGFMRTMQ